MFTASFLPGLFGLFCPLPSLRPIGKLGEVELITAFVMASSGEQNSFARPPPVKAQKRISHQGQSRLPNFGQFFAELTAAAAATAPDLDFY